jgi:hypothetical protein
VKLPPDQLEALDQWIAGRDSATSRPEALRALFRERLQPMMKVRFHEGHADNKVVLHDCLMPIAPREGETLTLRFPDRTEQRYAVKEVDYIIDVRTNGIGLTEDLTIARVAVSPL